MSNFYNPKRMASWNYGGKNWKLSRSKIDLFKECPKCFYIDNKMGTKRPPGFPFNLNSAVDKLFKKEFDIYRASQKPHPLMEKYGIKAIPFAHKDLDSWRENFVGVQYFHEPTGLTITGAIDDVWINKDDELIVVDYKSTSKDEEIKELNADWHDGYKKQMEVYQWLLRKKGFKVSDTGYFVYANGDTNKKSFNARLDFDITLIPYTGKDDWVEETIIQANEILKGDKIPESNLDCDYCKYRDTVREITKQKDDTPKQQSLI